jgi:hypothetical protein
LSDSGGETFSEWDDLLGLRGLKVTNNDTQISNILLKLPEKRQYILSALLTYFFMYYWLFMISSVVIV